MQLAYIDESGVPAIEVDKYFSLSAVIIEDSNWSNLDTKVRIIKKKWYPQENADDVEFPASEMLASRGCHKGVSTETRFKVFKEIYELISNEKVTIIGVIIDKLKIYPEKRKNFDVEQWAYRLLFERLNKFCAKHNAKRILSGKSEELCLMIIDSKSRSQDKRLRDKMLNFLRDGTYYAANKFIVEDPIFTDSKWRCISQLSDLVSYTIWRGFLKQGSNETLTKTFEGHFNLIKTKMDTDSKGNLMGCGLVVFPK